MFLHPDILESHDGRGEISHDSWLIFFVMILSQIINQLQQFLFSICHVIACSHSIWRPILSLHLDGFFHSFVRCHVFGMCFNYFWANEEVNDLCISDKYLIMIMLSAHFWHFVRYHIRVMRFDYFLEVIFIRRAWDNNIQKKIDRLWHQTLVN